MLNDVSHSINTDLIAAKAKLANARLCLEGDSHNTTAIHYIDGSIEHIDDVYDNAETILALEKYRVRTASLPPCDLKLPDDLIADLNVFVSHRSVLRLSGDKDRVNEVEQFFGNSSVSSWIDCAEPITVPTYKILRVALRDILKNALRHIRPRESTFPFKVYVSTDMRNVVIATSNNVPADQATVASVNSDNWELGDGHFGIQLYKVILDTLKAQYAMRVEGNWTTVTVSIPMARGADAETAGSRC
jgi:hypothetical protein